MKVDVVVYAANGRHVLGQADMYAGSWFPGIPTANQLDIDVAILSEQLEFVLHKKNLTGRAKHKLKLVSGRRSAIDWCSDVWNYYFECVNCHKRMQIGKSWVREALVIFPHWSSINPFEEVAKKSLGGCTVLSGE